MLQIIYTPTGTVVSEHSFLVDAEKALAVIETNPPSHEIIGEPEEEAVSLIVDEE
jgi:hypothetical protein